MNSALLLLPAGWPLVNSPQNYGIGFSWIQAAIGITQILVGFIQAVILWQLTYRIFRRNSEQKIAERHAAWFHKVVVDPFVLSLREFFNSADRMFRSASQKCIDSQQLSGGMEMWDEIATASISEFYSALLSERKSLIQAVTIFDSTAAVDLGIIMSNLQEQVSDWFETFRRERDLNSQDDLTEALNTCHNALLNNLRTVEFSHWGFQVSENAFSRLWEWFQNQVEEIKNAA